MLLPVQREMEGSAVGSVQSKVVLYYMYIVDVVSWTEIRSGHPEGSTYGSLLSKVVLYYV